MILTCPNCYSQFKVSLAVIGNQARHVRCSACGEVWEEHSHVEEHVEKSVDISDNEEVAGQDIVTAYDEVDIPDSIKPTDDEVEDEAKGGVASEKEQKIAYGIAACIFLVVFAYLMLSSTSMMRAHPSMQAFYAFFGIHLDIPTSDKITFANVKASDLETVVKVSGDIINLSAEAQTLRMMEITMSDGAEQIIAQWYLTPPKAVLGPEETVTFTTIKTLEDVGKHNDDGHINPVEHSDSGHDEKKDTHDTDHAIESVPVSEQHEGGTKYVRVRFVLSPELSLVKTDEEVAGNTPVPHADGNGHQNDHGASL